jgi:hypothetical protein
LEGSAIDGIRGYSRTPAGISRGWGVGLRFIPALSIVSSAYCFSAKYWLVVPWNLFAPAMGMIFPSQGRKHLENLGICLPRRQSDLFENPFEQLSTAFF